jgi:NAD(P)-dependent dehydrogenase (short-subunit alcohol dehydrogenase family)
MSRVSASMVARTAGRVSSRRDTSAQVQYGAGFTTGRWTRSGRVNAVALGIIRTPMHPAETHEVLAGMQPVGRMGEISDIVDAITYLEAAAFVTGEILHVDGGHSAGH